MTRRRRFALVALVIAAALGAGAVWWSGRGRAKPVPVPEELRYAAIRVVGVHAAIAECPTASSALVVGDTTNGLYRGVFGRGGVYAAGVKAPDIVYAVGPRVDWAALAKTAVASNGVYVWAFDTRKLTVAGFKGMLDAFPFADAHLWIIGENDWLLVGRTTAKVRLGDVLERFSDEGPAAELAEVGCDTFAELLAGYVGTRQDVEPAFSGRMDMPVRPEFFIAKEVAPLDWIDPADVDEDISSAVIGDYHTVQMARRTVVEGNILSLENGKMDDAIDKWAAALKRNPRDTMMLDRLYRLAVNARTFERIGNYKSAAKCYETMASVRPDDAAALMKFGECMKMLGEKEISQKAVDKAREMMK